MLSDGTGTFRRLYELTAGSAALLVGLGGLLLPLPTSRVISEAFPEFWQQAYFSAFTLAGALILLGAFTYGISAPSLERVGLLVGSACFLSYAVSILGERGLLAYTAAVLPLVIAAANGYRIWQVTKEVHRAKRAIRGG